MSTTAEYGITGLGRTGLARCGYFEFIQKYEQSALAAVAYLIRNLLGGVYELRCGTPWTACGAGRLGRGVPWPRAEGYPARANIAVCGASYCGRIVNPDAGPYAGMRPTTYPRLPAMALTESPGGPADPRQEYATAYDNPAMVLHITENDMAWADSLARTIRQALDMTSHLETPHGTINGLRVGPPKRINRGTRPRYELALEIQAEYIRPQEA